MGVFPIPRAEAVDNVRLPHVRGGVSREGAAMLHAKTSSPRAWGCFRGRGYDGEHHRVFPTCVGVFLHDLLAITIPEGLPHVRGGVSGSPFPGKGYAQSSPRAWGCFYVKGKDAYGGMVFPTCVGVFPGERSRCSPWTRLPHVRGGVSWCPFRILAGSWSSPRAWGCFRYRAQER